MVKHHNACWNDDNYKHTALAEHCKAKGIIISFVYEKLIDIYLADPSIIQD